MKSMRPVGDYIEVNPASGYRIRVVSDGYERCTCTSDSAFTKVEEDAMGVAASFDQRVNKVPDSRIT